VNDNPFVRLEAVCANAVERVFAVAFPSALVPVQVARKLVGAFEAAGAAGPRDGRRFKVRLHPSDYARFQNDLPYLEHQWSDMLARLAERSRTPERPPEVVALPDATIAAGTVAIGSEPRPVVQQLVLRVRKGVSRAKAIRLDRRFVIGRDPSCDFVLADPRVSRRHLEIAVDGEACFTDLGSSNGTHLNRMRVTTGRLACGDVLGLGDSELIVDAERPSEGER